MDKHSPLPQAHDPCTYKIIGAAMAVHRGLGCGFLEAVYRAALAIELAAQQIPYVGEVQRGAAGPPDGQRCHLRNLCNLWMTL